MPVRTGCPKTTHQWLKPLYVYLDGAISLVIGSGASGAIVGAAFGLSSPVTRIGNATGVIGMYGASGLAQIATGGLNASSISPTYFGQSGWASTGVGGSGLYTYMAHYAANGGSGNWYTFDDMILELKNLNILKP